MVKKAFVLFLALVFFLVPISQAKAGSDPWEKGKSRPQLQMTQEQKDKMIALKIQLLELRKQIVAENVQKGLLSTKEGQSLEKRINKRLEQLKAGKLRPDISPTPKS